MESAYSTPPPLKGGGMPARFLCAGKGHSSDSTRMYMSDNVYVNLDAECVLQITGFMSA